MVGLHVCVCVCIFWGVMTMFSHPSNNLFAGGLSQLQLCGGTVQWEGAWLEWHGFLGLSDSTGVSQCEPSVLYLGWVGSWPGAGYHTNFSYFKCAQYIAAGGPCRQSGEQDKNCDILIMVFGLKWTCSLTTTIMLLEILVQVGNSSSGLDFSITHHCMGCRNMSVFTS